MLKKPKLIFSILLSFLLFVFLAKYIDLNSIFRMIKNCEITTLLLGILIAFLFPILTSLRWILVLSAFEKKINFFKSFSSIMISLSANILAPAKTGDFIKVILLKDFVDKSTLSSAVIAERIGDIMSLTLLVIIGSIFLKNYTFLGIASSCFVLGIVGIIFISKFKNINFKYTLIKWFYQIFHNASNIWVCFPIKMLKVMSFTFLNWILASVQIWLFMVSLGATVSLEIVIMIFPIIIFITLMPFSFGGLGLRETAFVFCFIDYVDPNISISSSLFYYICNVGLMGVIGIVFVYMYLGGLDKNLIK